VNDAKADTQCVAYGVSENQRAEVRLTPYSRQITSGGGKPGQGYPCVAFQPRYARNGRGVPDTVAVPLTAEAGRTGKGDSSQCVAFDTTQITSPGNYSNPKLGDPCHPLALGAYPPAVSAAWGVRRLTPTECERLQGFDDGWTAGQSDSACYKQLGNAVCVANAQWIGRRIAEA